MYVYAVIFEGGTGAYDWYEELVGIFEDKEEADKVVKRIPGSRVDVYETKPQIGPLLGGQSFYECHKPKGRPWSIMYVDPPNFSVGVSNLRGRNGSYSISMFAKDKEDCRGKLKDIDRMIEVMEEPI